MPWPLDRKRRLLSRWGLGGIVGYVQKGIELDAGGQPFGQFSKPSPPKAAKAAKAGRSTKRGQGPNLGPLSGYAAMDCETPRGLIEIRGDEGDREKRRPTSGRSTSGALAGRGSTATRFAPLPHTKGSLLAP